MEDIINRYVLGQLSLDAAARELASDTEMRFLRVRAMDNGQDATEAALKVEELFRLARVYSDESEL